MDNPAGMSFPLGPVAEGGDPIPEAGVLLPDGTVVGETQVGGDTQ